MENAVFGEQVIFGWVDWRGKSGFHFITSSCSLDQSDYDYMSKYSLPVNSESLHIVECRRLFVLPSGKIAMNYVKDIGKDAHGRDGALYSHFLILARDAFIQVKRNLSVADIHHLKGISSINDLRKLILPDGNAVKLPQVIIELPVKEHSPLKKFLMEENEQFISDLVYAVFINIFQPDTKINLMGTEETDAFEQMSLVESIFPSWIVIPFSTYRYTGQDMDPFIVMCLTDSTLLDPDHVIVDFHSRSVSVPGEDNFIRLVSSEYINILMTDTNLEHLNTVYRPGGDATPQFSLIQHIIMGICKGPDKQRALRVSLMVSSMGIYGNSSFYSKVISQIMKDTHYSLESAEMIINAISHRNMEAWAEGGVVYDYISILLKVGPGDEGEETITKFLVNFIKGKGSQASSTIFSMIMDDSVSPEIAGSIIELIPNVPKLYTVYMEKHSVTEMFLQRSLVIFGEFREMREILLKGFEIFLTGEGGKDQTTVVRVLRLLENNVKLFEPRSMNRLLKSLQKTIKKQRVPIRSEVEDSIGHLKDAETRDGESEE